MGMYIKMIRVFSARCGQIHATVEIHDPDPDSEAGVHRIFFDVDLRLLWM
jgi:hypothetical protein